MTISLRPWQENAINKSLKWFIEKKQDKRFLINAAPGAGKTICALSIANELFKRNKIDRVIVIAPRREVVKQWKNEFKLVTGRSMIVTTGGTDDHGLDICSTWNSVQNNLDLFQLICSKYRTLIICDEHHHAAIDAVWGVSANNAFVDSKYVIVLTGTPIRSDGNKPVWFGYSSNGDELSHPEEGTFTLTYGESVDLKYCRPAFFHRHEGNFSVVMKKGGERVAVSGSKGIIVNDKYGKKISNVIQKSIDYYTLARTPTYLSDNKTPDLNSYQSTMLQWGISKLDETKDRLPSAAGLVIAPNIKVAEYMAKLLEKLTDQKPMIVHSNMPNSDDKIEAFRNSDKDWIVSVAMINEGVDIKRLRVLVYLPNAQTELSFRQAIGRVVRSMSSDDDSRAYVIMPTHSIFESYARRIEREMLNTKIDFKTPKNTRVCPKCENECLKIHKECEICGYEFPPRKMNFKNCNKCNFKNPINLKNCQNCGDKFGEEYTVTLKNALRLGGIAREMDVSENDVLEAEKYYKSFREELIKSGDARVIEVLSLFPDETLGKIKRILDKIDK